MSQERRSVLSSEVSTLRQSCNQLEKSMMELQGNLETKNASLASLGNDLKVAEEQYNRLMAKVEEMQNTVSTRDNTGEYVTETRPRETRGGRGRLFSLKRLCFLLGFFTVQDLRQQMATLQNQYQQVQLERSTLQSRLKTSQAEIESLQQVRQWYQQQLGLAQEARVRLQNQMANMQVRRGTEGGGG